MHKPLVDGRRQDGGKERCRRWGRAGPRAGSMDGGKESCKAEAVRQGWERYKG